VMRTLKVMNIGHRNTLPRAKPRGESMKWRFACFAIIRMLIATTDPKMEPVNARPEPIKS
jgi:hypothetical protein